MSYVSLQSPPGRDIQDTVQFETLDLYLWTGPGFQSPALLFYAGPTYFDEPDITSQSEEVTLCTYQQKFDTITTVTTSSMIEPFLNSYSLYYSAQ